jgi:hypothetical protein
LLRALLHFWCLTPFSDSKDEEINCKFIMQHMLNSWLVCICRDY